MKKDEAIKEIKQLKELLDSGILTQDEYNDKSADLKKIILDSEKKKNEPSESENLTNASTKEKKKNSKEQKESLWTDFALGWLSSFRNLDPNNPREEWRICRDRAITVLIIGTLFGIMTSETEPYWGFGAVLLAYIVPLPFAYLTSILLNAPLIFRVISGKITKKDSEWVKYEREVLSNLTVEIFWLNIGKRNRWFTFIITIAIIGKVLLYIFD